VEIVDTTGIVEANAFLKVWGDLGVTHNRKDASDATNSDTAAWGNGHAGCCSDGDTASEGSVLNVDHVELVSMGVVRADESGGSGGRNGKKGVDDGALLLVDGGKSRVERRPEHEKEDCS
jgi:hypothetical protein